jgi:flagellar hook-basal body complex protein FliE
MASNSGCTEVLVDGASTANLPRGASESVTALECHSFPVDPGFGGAMISRDDYVSKLKAQIDEWNAQAAKWEATGAKNVEQFRARRDEALAELRRVQSASANAWRDMMRGADSALKDVQEAFDKARKQFDKR